MRAEDILRRCADRNIQVEGKNGRLLVNPASALTPDLRMELKRGSRMLLRRLESANASPVLRLPPPSTRYAEKAPLSPYQLGLYNLHLDERDNTNVLNQTGVLDLLFVPTEQEVMASFEKLLEIHGALRLSIRISTDGKPEQFLDARRPVRPEIHQTSPENFNDKIAEILEAYKRTPFSMASDPLIRASYVAVPEQRAAFVLCVDHLIMDGWSVGILLEDWQRLLSPEAGSIAAAQRQQELQYTDYAAWAAEILLPAVREKQAAYWRNVLPLGSAPHAFPTKVARGNDSVRSCGLIQTRLRPELLTELRQWAARHGCSLFAALHTALRVALYRTSGQEDAPILTVSANRQQLEGTARMVGCFINVLPLYCPLDGDAPLCEELRQSNAAVLAALDNQDIPFCSIVDALGRPRVRAWQPIGQIMFLLQNAFAGRNAGKMRVRLPDHPVTEHELSFIVWDFGVENTWLHVEYREDLFEKERIQLLMDNFSRICEALPHAEEHTARGLTSDARPYPGPEEQTESAKGLRRLLSALRTDENAAVLGRLLQALATHFPSARPSEVLCLWRGGNTQARHMLQKACILGGITLALAYEDEDVSSLITAMRHPPLGVLAVGEKSLSRPAMPETKYCEIVNVLWEDLLQITDLPAGDALFHEGKGIPPLLVNDGESPAAWQAYDANAFMAGLEETCQNLSGGQGQIRFLENEDADRAGIVALAALLQGIIPVWGHPDDAICENALPVTTNWESALRLLQNGVQSLWIMDDLPTAAFLAKNRSALDRCRLFLRIPRSLRWATALLDGQGWQGDERFCRAVIGKNILPADCVCGEPAALGNLFRAVPLSSDTLSIPLPSAIADHLWFKGRSVNLDALTDFLLADTPGSSPHAALAFAAPETSGSLLDIRGECILWHDGSVASDAVKNLLFRIPPWLPHAHAVELTQMPLIRVSHNRRLRPDRHYLSLLPIATEELLKRFFQRYSHSSFARQGLYIAENDFFADQVQKLAVAYAVKATDPHDPDPLTRDVLFTQGPDRFARPVVPDAVSVPDWDRPFAPDRFCLLINGAGDEGRMLVQALRQRSTARFFLLEQPGSSDSALPDQTVRQALERGRQSFDALPGGLLHLVHSPQGNGRHISPEKLGEKFYHPFHLEAPEAPVICLLRDGCSPSFSSRHRAGMAGENFDALCDYFAGQNKFAPHTHLCLCLPVWRNADTARLAASRIFRMLQSGHDNVIAGKSPADAIASGHMQGFAYPARYLHIRVSRGDALPPLPHPLALAASLPTAPRLVAHASESGASEAWRTLVQIWKEVLELDDPDPEANFFDVGGSSVLIPPLRDKIRQNLGVDIGMAGIFTYSNLNDLHMHIASLANNAASPGPLPSGAPAPSRENFQRKVRQQKKRQHEVFS